MWTGVHHGGTETQRNRPNFHHGRHGAVRMVTRGEESGRIKAGRTRTRTAYPYYIMRCLNHRLVGQIDLCVWENSLVVTRKWLLVSTQRLYLEDRKDDGRQGVAWQRFVVENGSVLPQIITRNNADRKS